MKEAGGGIRTSSSYLLGMFDPGNVWVGGFTAKSLSLHRF